MNSCVSLKPSTSQPLPTRRAVLAEMERRTRARSSQTTVEIKPQPGPQTEFLSSPADIVIYGGCAGGGKSYGLMIEPLRHVCNSNFGAVIFRRTLGDVKKQGSLLDTSYENRMESYGIGLCLGS